MSKITKADVKDELPDHKVDRVAADNPKWFQKATDKAIIWVQSKYRQCDEGDPDWDDTLVVEAALQRAKYVIYALQENEDVAADKKENAQDLIVAVLGGCAAGREEGESAPAAAVEEMERPSWMDGFEGRENPRDDGRHRVP